MSADKRSVHTDALATLGTILGGDEARDAIHLAVEPVQAAHDLMPGQDVGILPCGRAGVTADKFVGIVDPFLRNKVARGERFWLIVYPRTITSLRHVWEHPDFKRIEHIDIVHAGTQTANDKAYSERWMREWALRHVSYDYYGEGTPKTGEEALEYAIEAGRDMNIGPYESARDYIDEEWWVHWERITGEKGQRGEYFSCSC